MTVAARRNQRAGKLATAGAGSTTSTAPDWAPRAPVMARTKLTEGSAHEQLSKSKLRTVSDFVHVYQADPIERVELIKLGIPATYVFDLATALHWTREQLFKELALARATVDRKASKREKLSQDQTERVVGLMKLVGQVKTMVEQSGDPEGFDAARWVGEWLQIPNAALGNRRPAELMDTLEGQEIVAGLLAKMQSGAYA